MTVALDPEQLNPRQVVTTPTVRRFLRTARFWIAAAVVIVLAVIGYTILTPPALDAQPLAADGTGETGAGAVVAVLREHGVSVTATTSLVSTQEAVTSQRSTTVLVYDPSGYLDSDQRIKLLSLAAHVIVVSPTASALHDFAPQLVGAGAATATMKADCSIPAAVRANTITDGGRAYRLRSGADSVSTCFPSGVNGFALAQLPTSAGNLTIVGTTKAFTNEFIGDRGNAALAINLLGSTSKLLWYLPSIEDIGQGGHTESIASAAPHWITPLLLLGVSLAFIAAAVWRGRRFGPLVVERLPVLVRASETMEGRARLYQSSSARLRALDSVRVGTVERVAVLCGLSRRASVDEVIGAVSEATGRRAHDVRELLVGRLPRNDADLISISDELLVLERDVADATLPT